MKGILIAAALAVLAGCASPPQPGPAAGSSAADSERERTGSTFRYPYNSRGW